MKKFYLITLFAMICNFASAQIEPVAYRGAFAPAPAAMWTDNWTNWNPNSEAYTEGTVVNITADITANTTFVTGTTYKLTGLIYVRNNAILTIQPGVIVKGVYTTTGTALIVTKGAKLNAIGTASQPIVFTSNQPAGSRAAGDWGGVVLLGKGRFSSLAASNTGTNNIEGITATVNTEYGGGLTPSDTDSSGTLKYVRIEFGGFVFSNNNEINGLTMGACGSGTVVDYVQVSYANDDSFEWFGGAVNCKHLVAFKGLDDDFDADNGYKGTVQFALGVKDPGVADNPVVSTSEGFEADNNPAGVTVQSGWDNTTAIFSNCTLIGASGRAGLSVATGHERPLRLRRGVQLKVFNSIFMDFKSNYLFVDGTLAIANANAGLLKFKNNIIAGVPNATYTSGVRGASASDLTAWFNSNNNSYVASSGILTAPYNTADYTDYNANGTTIDYRPGTLAATGASFSDASLVALLPAPTPAVSSKIEQVSYRGAFAPAPAAMWTDNWTNWNPNSTAYTDATNVVTISSNITTDTTFFTGTTYKLDGLIYVTDNATLTIQPGVVIKGLSVTTGTALIITKGAKLNAIGTANAPIVFTSDKAAGSRAPGDWGGVVLLGKGRFSSLATGNTGVNNIEGITASVNTQYGGGTTPDDADSSGTLKYVRIEFGGFVFSTNNEINGLTMGAVGSGTVVDYVQVSYTNDDSFEWFGGAVNCKHLVAYRGIDDDFDTDNGYKGLVQFALGIKDPALADNPAVSTSEGFESDNNPGGVVPESGWDNTSPIFSNCTLIGPSGRTGVSVATGHERPLRLRRATQIKVYNSIFMDFKTNYLFVDGSLAQANANAGLLKFQNNIIAGVPNATYPSGIRTATANGLDTWFTSNNNTYTTSAGILTAPYNTANYNDYNANTVTIDYRPGILASTGASFTDASILPFVAVGVPTTTPLTFCQGATGLSSLTAVLSTAGVSLRWYTSATTATFTTTAPTPTTATVGVKTFYVAEVNSFGVASTRVPLTVTIIARPTIGLGTIKGVDALTAPTVNVGLYLGTTTEFTYSIVTAADTTVTSYLWTVPSGVNITSGQGTNTITVNYLNVPAGAGTVGTILAQGINAAGCPGVASKLTIKKALATAPALKMYDKGSLKPTSALVSFGQFAGTSTPVTLVATNVLTATGYQWELPVGVSLVLGGVTPVTTTATFTAEPFLAPTSAPTTVGTKFWVVTYNTYENVDVNGVPTKIVTSNAVQKIYGSTAYGGTTTAPYVQYGTVITSNLSSIIVDFAGVATTSAMYLGVKSLNGVGASVTNNAASTNATLLADIAANVPGVNYNLYTEVTTPAVAPSTNATSTYVAANPSTTPSTARLLKVVSVTPLAPASIRSLSGIVSVTNISTYLGTTNVLTLTASPVANASSYTWTLPAGVNQLTGGNTNTITVNYAGVALGTATIVIAVKANNNVGSSSYKTLTLTAGLPSTPAVTGSLAICPTAASSVVYTIPVLATRATSYVITLPAGATIAGNATATIAAVPGATFTVDFVSGFTSTSAAPLYINVASVNGFGSNLVNRVLKLTNIGAVCGSRVGASTKDIQTATTAQVYPNPTSGEFSIELTLATDSNVSVAISSLVGSLVGSRNIALTAGNQVINENISSLSNGVYVVTIVNSTSGEVITKKLIKE